MDLLFENKKGRRFVLGSTRKSGYPYAQFTGWMNIVPTQKGRKAQIWLKTTDWHVMGLGVTNAHESFQTMATGMLTGLRMLWDSNMQHPTKLLEGDAKAKSAPV
jgi:hypothetical protein